MSFVAAVSDLGYGSVSRQLMIGIEDYNGNPNIGDREENVMGSKGKNGLILLM